MYIIFKKSSDAAVKAISDWSVDIKLLLQRPAATYQREPMLSGSLRVFASHVGDGV